MPSSGLYVAFHVAFTYTILLVGCYSSYPPNPPLKGGLQSLSPPFKGGLGGYRDMYYKPKLICSIYKSKWYYSFRKQASGYIFPMPNSQCPIPHSLFPFHKPSIY